MASFTRLLLVIFGLAFGALFAVVVLLGLAFYVTFASVRWLVTGQKPQVLMMWQQIQASRNKGMKTSKSALWSWSQTSDGQRHEEHGLVQRWDPKVDVVEDAVVREVKEKCNLPKD